MEFKYFAFISYNSEDIEWGKCLQRKLEGYKLPSTLCNKHGWKRKPINPVFFAPSDIQPGDLSEELKERLRASQNLIVICSPNSAQSDWVGKEIEFFYHLGRTSQIHYFIIDGIPHSKDPETECLNKKVYELNLPEILGANINERTQTFPYTNIHWHWLDKERAYVQLISKLLNVEFDSIWKRHQRQLIERFIAWSIGLFAILAIIFCVWKINQPIEVSVTLQEVSAPNKSLPPLHNGIISLSLDNEKKVDTVPTLDYKAIFSNVPHRFIGKKVRVQFECKDYIPVDTVITLEKNVKFSILRNPNVYGNINFKLRNYDRVIPHIPLNIAGYTITSDDEGYIKLFIPLQKQKKFYIIKSPIILDNDTLFMPCGPDDVVIAK